MNPRLRIMLAPLLVTLLLSACDRRASEIRAQLTPDEVQVFNRGAQLAGKCWECHDLYSTAPKVGPGLLGFVGRAAGGNPDSPASQALKQSGVVWDARALSAFLADGQRFIPGNGMVYAGFRDPEQFRALFFYLERATRRPSPQPSRQP